MFSDAGVRSIARRVLPARVRRGLWALWRLRRRTLTGRVRFGDLRRLKPISRGFGHDRGQPIDRYYVEDFLARQAGDIRGRVLEIGNDSYAQRFGNGRVTLGDALDAMGDDPRATMIADPTRIDDLPSEAFDCVIFTQTLQLVYDMRPAVRALHRVLKPGGVLLATFPGIAQINRKQDDDYWRWSFTRLLARRLFGEAFPATNVRVESYGNVLAAISLLNGLAAEELHRAELDHHDPDYEVLVALRAVKATS